MVALLRKMTCNLRHPIGLRHPVVCVHTQLIVVRHVLRHVLQHVLQHVLRHVLQHVLQHVLRHVLWHVLQHVLWHVLWHVLQHVTSLAIAVTPLFKMQTPKRMHTYVYACTHANRHRDTHTHKIELLDAKTGINMFSNMSHIQVLYEWVMAHVNESCHIWTSHGTSRHKDKIQHV